MIFSRKVFGKSKMSQWEYIFQHCIPRGLQSMRRAFINWMDLVWFESNQKHYALLPNDDPFEQCRLYFWDELEDDVIEKEFIEFLYAMEEQVNKGEVEYSPFTEEMYDHLTELLDDINRIPT